MAMGVSTLADMNEKVRRGNFFEDFQLGQEIAHATPRTLGEGDAALYLALYGSRFPLHCSDDFARKLGYRRAPLDDWLVFHMVFGRTVADISWNAVSNLGYADGRLGVPVYPGDTIRATSRVIGLRETSNREAGIVYVRTRGINQRGETVADYARWVMVRKRDPWAAPPPPKVPDLPASVPPDSLELPPGIRLSGYDSDQAGSPFLWDDYAVGERLDHVDGTTVEEVEQMMVTRLYQNNAPVHLNEHLMKGGRFGGRIVMAGHIISVVRALTFNGFSNAFRVAAINGGRHTAPVIAGDTLYAWSEVLEKAPLRGCADAGVLRVRTTAVKNRTCADYPYRDANGGDDPAVVLDLDYSVLLPRRF